MARELIRSRLRLSAARREHIQKVGEWKAAVQAGTIDVRFPMMMQEGCKVYEVWDNGDVRKVGGGEA